MLIKIGSMQAWIERTPNTEWKPHLETIHGSKHLWFLKMHLILDRG